MIAGFPDSVSPNASSLKRKLKPPDCLTPPWQEMHLVFIMGRTSALKSTFCSLKPEKTANIIATEKTVVRKIIMAFLLPWLYKESFMKIFIIPGTTGT
jgi:hypothetical protein